MVGVTLDQTLLLQGRFWAGRPAAVSAGINQNGPKLYLATAAASALQQTDQCWHQLQLKGPGCSTGAARRQHLGYITRWLWDKERASATAVPQDLLRTQRNLLHEPGENGITVSSPRLLIFLLAAATTTLQLSHHRSLLVLVFPQQLLSVPQLLVLSAQIRFIHHTDEERAKDGNSIWCILQMQLLQLAANVDLDVYRREIG